VIKNNMIEGVHIAHADHNQYRITVYRRALTRASTIQPHAADCKTYYRDPYQTAQVVRTLEELNLATYVYPYTEGIWTAHVRSHNDIQARIQLNREQEVTLGDLTS